MSAPRRVVSTRLGAAALAISAAMAMLAQPVAAQLPPTTTTTAAVAAPVITSVWPPTGPAAGNVTVFVNGDGFSGATSVRFGGRDAISFTIDNDERLTAVVPPSATAPAPEVAVDVVVRTPAGTSAAAPEATFRYWAPPRIVAVSPDPLTSSFEGGQFVTLTVEDLGDWPQGVYVDGTSVGYSYERTRPGEVRFIAWPHQAGPVDVVVQGDGGRSAPVTMTYLDTPLPRLDALTPDAGSVEGGTTVVVTGSGFTGATSVAFNGQYPVASFTVDSDTQITLVTPWVPQAGTYRLVVTTPAGPAPWWTDVSFRFDGPPVIVDVQPPTGPLAGGNPVFISGADLDHVTNVWFGDVPAPSFAITDWYALVAIAPPHAAGTVNVTVDSTEGRSREVMPYEYTSNAVATIHGIEPDFGPVRGGTTVVLTGSGFASTTAVTFGDAGPAASFTIDSDSQLTVVTPPGPFETEVHVTVTNAAGDSVAVPSGVFTFLPPPTLWEILPGGGSTAGGTEVTISGSEIHTARAVRFGDVPVPFTYDPAAGVLRAVSPPHGAGPVAVVVENPNGESPSEPAWGNTYVYAPPGVPILTATSTTTGSAVGGDELTIWGVDLDNVTGVRFGTVAAPSFRLEHEWGVTRLLTITPPHAPGGVDIVLESAAGESQPVPNGRFEYYPQPPPALSWLFPTEGPVTGGGSVDLWGSAFTDATSVTFGGVPASFTVLADNHLVVVVPPAHDQSGESLVRVQITTPVGTSDVTWSNSLYGYKLPTAPAVRRLSPNRGPVAGGNQVIVDGSGFTGATSVRFGTHEAEFEVQNDQRIVAVAPAVADPYLYDVTVTSAIGANPSATSSWYLYRSEPVVWGIEANSGSVLGGNTVTITGDQFLDAWGVSFGWNNTSFQVIDQHTIVATVPACAAGTVWVTVLTPEGTSAVTFGSLYTYRTPGAPIVTSTDANRGSTAGGDTVVLTGAGFTGTTGVRFEDTPASSFTVDSDTRITAVVPPRVDPALVNISVDSPNGTNPNAPASWFLYD